MSRDRAAYMREYRAKRKAAQDEREMGFIVETGRIVHDMLQVDIDRLTVENKRLADTVTLLRQELAARPVPTDRTIDTHGNPYRDFRPVPKPGHK